MLTLQSEDESARCKEQWDVSLLISARSRVMRYWPLDFVS